MPPAGLILHTLTSFLSLVILVIICRFLLWPRFKKHPIAVGIALAFGIVVLALMIVFDV